MTTGQRIAQKRKEAELSQEALGAELGVSRQSIYKWESDAALPEIDKLVSLSRRFGVTVGWLLGVEESPEAEQPVSEKELTDAQLKMVEEITNRYISALPKPSKRKKWYLFALCVILLVGWKLHSQLSETERHYQALQSDIWRIQDNTSTQIYGIASRVEEILKQQNDLTANYSVEITEIIPNQSSGSVTLAVSAVPKTFTDGMSAEFSVDNGHGSNIKVVQPVRDQNGDAIHETFATTLSCELTDSITVSVVFILPDGTRQTQILENYTGLYSESLPEADIVGGEMLDESGTLADGVLKTDAFQVAAKASWYGWWGSFIDTEIIPESIQVGLFKNQKLLAWAQEVPHDTSRWQGFEDFHFFQFSPVTTPFSDQDMIEVAAVVTDQYGRQSVTRSYFPPFVADANGSALVWAEESLDQDTDPSHWSLQ